MILLSSALVVAFFLGKAVVLWALLALPLVILYPFMKRISWWPQLFLGLTFNWGALMGWVAVRGTIEWPAIALYAGGVFWTLGYDTIYAHQDTLDDARIGVKSTALRLGRHSRTFIAAFYVAAVGCWLMAGVLTDARIFFYIVLMLVLFQLLIQIFRVDLVSAQSCRKAFISNRWIGAWVCFGIIL